MVNNIDYKLLIEKSSEGIVVVQEGKIVFVNERSYKLLKYGKLEMIGRPIMDFIHPHDKDEVLARYKMKISGKRLPGIYEARLLTSEKKVLTVRFNSSKIMWDGIPATLSFVTDITKDREKEIKDENGRKKAYEFMNVTGMMLVSVGKDKKVDYINKKGLEVLGCRENEVVGKNWFANFLPKANRENVLKIFNLLLGGKKELADRYENLVLTKNKEERIIYWHNSVLKNEEGEVTHIISSGEDITDRKRIELALKESEEKFKAVFNNSADAIYLKDSNLRYLIANSQAEKILGAPLSKIIGKKDSQINKAKGALAEEKLELEVLKGKPYTKEKSVIVKGQKKYFVISKSPIRDAKMNIIGLSGVERDITERRKREKELFLKNKFNNDILENNPIGIFVVDENGDVEYVNKSMLNISSADYNRFISLNMLSHKAYVKLGIAKNIEKTLKKGESFRMDKVEYTSTFGKKTTIRNFIGVPLEEDGHKKALIMVEDVTDRLSFEKKISDQNDFLMTIINSLSYPFYVVDVSNYELLLANKEAMKNGEAKTCFELSHGSKTPCNSKEHGCPISEIVKTKKPAMMEHLHVGGNGKARHVEVHGYPIFGPSGKVEKIIEYSIDISEKKEAEIKIKEQEGRYQDILDNASDLIQSVGIKGEILYANKSWKEKMGYSDKEIKKLNIFKLIYPEDLLACKTEFDDVINGKRFGNLETRFIAKNGDIVYLNGAVSCRIEDGKAVSTRGIFRDVTKQHQEQEELKKRNLEIEKFNKLAVGRELKMIELKKIIRELEGKISGLEKRKM